MNLLKTDTTRGIDSSTIVERTEKYGKNQSFSEANKKTIVELIIEPFKNIRILLLLISSILSIIVNHSIEVEGEPNKSTLSSL